MTPDQAEDKGNHDGQIEDAVAQAEVVKGGDLSQGGRMDQVGEVSLDLWGRGSEGRSFGAVTLDGAGMADGGGLLFLDGSGFLWCHKGNDTNRSLAVMPLTNGSKP